MFNLLLAVIYLAFISLGLPDSLLGSAWPVMHGHFSVPISYAGIISAIIACGTILSSLSSNFLSRRLGSGLLCALSTGLTALALMGFALSESFALLMLLALPYGFGAGGVDASLNNYVALHYSGRHMNWLHCMWGIGASTGPYIMALALTGQGWQQGYWQVALIQAVICLLLFLSLPLWRTGNSARAHEHSDTQVSTVAVLKEPGVGAALLYFFCYCAIEQTAGLWASSYLVYSKSMSAQLAASYAALYFIGISLGRAAAGFVSPRLGDHGLIKLGLALMALALLLLPMGTKLSLAGLMLLGLGSAPLYPCMIHATPGIFGAHRSQAVIGLQVASAYVGILFMPPVFGWLARRFGSGLLPAYLGLLLLLMLLVYRRILKVKKV